MEKHTPPPPRLIEQLQGVHVRQQKVIQQLQTENARLLTDLVELRQERDAFRAQIARARKEMSELQNRLDEVGTEYQDLKRERAALLRSNSFSATSAGTYGRKLSTKLWNTVSALDQGLNEPPSGETTSVESTGPKSESNNSENQPSNCEASNNPGHPLQHVPSPYMLHLNI